MGPVAGPVVGPAAGGRAGGLAAYSARRGSGSIAFQGHGNGHGHGLSQYGAKGAAESGLSYRRIISFYYPHTGWARTRGDVRVLITADTSRDLVVLDRAHLGVRKVGAHGFTALHSARPAARRWRLLGASRGRTLVDYQTTGSRWHRFSVIGGDAEVGARGAPVRVVLPVGTAAYRGILRAVTPDPGASDGPLDRDTVNVVDLEAYLRGVVPVEMPALWSGAAVRAQAVAARSYAAYERAHPPRHHYQLCDTASCQVYGGVGVEHVASDAAIRATAHQARFHDRKPAFTQFSASNGGWMAAGSVPYLVAKRDRHERGSGNPYATWHRAVQRSAIESHWPAIGTLASLDLTDRDGHGDWNGRVGTVVLHGRSSTVRVSGEEFRSVLALPSTWFTKS